MYVLMALVTWASSRGCIAVSHRLSALGVCYTCLIYQILDNRGLLCDTCCKNCVRKSHQTVSSHFLYFYDSTPICVISAWVFTQRGMPAQKDMISYIVWCNLLKPQRPKFFQNYFFCTLTMNYGHYHFIWTEWGLTHSLYFSHVQKILIAFQIIHHYLLNMIKSKFTSKLTGYIEDYYII